MAEAKKFMRYNVAQLLKEPIGSTREHQLNEDFTGPQRFADKACGPVHMLRTHQGVLVRATLGIQSNLSCARCLSNVVNSSEVSIEEEFFPKVDLHTGRSLPRPDDAEETSLIDDDHILDLFDTINEYVVSSLPMKPLCNAGCKGLCQACGANLNLGACQCDGQLGDPRWQALAAFAGE